MCLKESVSSISEWNYFTWDGNQGKLATFPWESDSLVTYQASQIGNRKLCSWKVSLSITDKVSSSKPKNLELCWKVSWFGLALSRHLLSLTHFQPALHVISGQKWVTGVRIAVLQTLTCWHGRCSGVSPSPPSSLGWFSTAWPCVCSAAFGESRPRPLCTWSTWPW